MIESMRMVSILQFAALLSFAASAPANLHQHGLDTLAAIETRFRLPSGLYADFVTLDANGKATRSGPSTIWAGGVMLSALNAAAEIDRDRLPAAIAYAKALDAYRWQQAGEPLGYQPFPVGKDVGDMYYDDNAWLVLAFLETYQLSGDEQFLRRARDAYAYLVSGESDDLGGGIWWADFRKTKNTCSTAPAIVAALSLYEIDHDPAKLALAQRLHAWIVCLQDADGLFFDNLRAGTKEEGKAGELVIEKTKWSYNSALMIRANVMLHRTTGDARYLAEAKRIAAAAEARWFKEDGSLADEGAFAHLLCEALFELDKVVPEPDRVPKIVRALDWVASLGRDNAYPKRWDRPLDDAKNPKLELLQQASAARAFLFTAAHTSNQTPSTRPSR